MKKELIEWLNTQVINKLESAYLYLEFSNFFNSNGQNRYEIFYKERAKEEINDALYIYDYLRNKDVKEVFELNRLFVKLQELSNDTSLTQLIKDFISKYTKDNIDSLKIINLSKSYAL